MRTRTRGGTWGRGLLIAGALGMGVAPAARAQDAPADSSAKNPEQEGLPLEPGRRIRMTVDRGSWMSVDVSPDGATLADPCPETRDGIVLRPVDGGHYEAEGAAWTARRLLDALYADLRAQVEDTAAATDGATATTTGR